MLPQERLERASLRPYDGSHIARIALFKTSSRYRDPRENILHPHSETATLHCHFHRVHTERQRSGDSARAKSAPSISLFALDQYEKSYSKKKIFAEIFGVAEHDE